MKILRKILVILFILYSGFFFAQDNIEQNFKSPEIADLSRFGNVPIAMNAGRIDLTIPLVEINDGTFEMPITLSYNSAGFMPMKSDGVVGLNWSLNSGGVITREVKGFPDDAAEGQYSFNHKKFYGFAYFLKNKNNQKDIEQNPSNYIIQGFDSSPTPFLWDKKNNCYVETSSDIYYFNFGKHSGRFTINFDGTVNVVSNSGGEYKILLDRYQPANFNNAAAPAITIITDDGYCYVFGGVYDAVEYTYSWADGNFIEKRHENIYRPTISSYHLSHIQAPNGQSLMIRYKSLPFEYHEGGEMAYKFASNYALNYKHNYIMSYNWSVYKQYSDQPDFNWNVDESTLNHVLTKTALIDRIETENQVIQFFYNDKVNPVDLTKIFNSKDTPFDLARNAGCQLSQIIKATKYSIESNSAINPLNSIKFEYNIWKGGPQGTDRLLLDKIQNEYSGAEYKMEYLTDDLSPSILSKNIDYWNYWRGLPEDESYSLIPTMNNILVNKDIIYTNQRREPTAGMAGFGLLSKIIYPTGGYTSFKYERHDYSWELLRRSANSYLPKLYSTDFLYQSPKEITGGARIQEIRNGIITEGTLKEEIKEILYKDSLTSKKSSGILNYKPIYAEQASLGAAPVTGGYAGYAWANNPYKYIYITGAGFNPQAYERDHITYSSVIQVRYDKTSIADEGELYDIYSRAFSNTPINTTLTFNDISDEIEIMGLGDEKKGQKATVILRQGSNTRVINFSNSSTEKIFHTPNTLGLNEGQYNLVIQSQEYTRAQYSVRKKKIWDEISNKDYIITRYLDYHDIPDILNEKVLGTIGVTGDDAVDNYNENFRKELIDRSYMRGKIKNEAIYNSQNRIIKRNEYTYTQPNNPKSSIYFNKLTPVTSVHIQPGSGGQRWKYANYHIFGPYYQMNFVEFFPSQLESIVTREYIYNRNGDTNPVKDSITTKKMYSYDISSFYLNQEIETNSDGAEIVTKYTRVYDLDDYPYSLMKQQNILSPIIKIEKLINGEISSIVKKHYSIRNGLPIIDSIQSGINHSHMQTTEKYTDYNNHVGNPIRFMKLNGIPIIYLWSYNGQYPVAKIENGELSSVRQAVRDIFGLSLDELSQLYNPDINKLQGLQSHSRLKKAQITIYTYEPSIGIHKVIDPRGVTSHYNYEGGGRLSSIAIDDKESGIPYKVQYLETYKYNFKTSK